MGRQHFAFDIHHLKRPSQCGASSPCFLLLKAAPDIICVRWEEPAQQPVCTATQELNLGLWGKQTWVRVALLQRGLKHRIIK